MESDPTTSIPAFYAGRSIFITGGTGFMGKVLIEKLLRSCPDVREIFLLMRPKKGVSIDNRLRTTLTSPLFDKLRDKDPSVFEKLIPVTGDVTEEGLGLPTIERKVLIEKVSVIFHVAASVRFDDPLAQAIIMNIRGTREVCILAASMKKLVASRRLINHSSTPDQIEFKDNDIVKLLIGDATRQVLLHVSTTYGNTDRPVVNEILYPAHANWKEAIQIAETIDQQTLNIMTAKYLDKMPNTYTFTKQLAEHVINDYAGVMPIVIFRPSVVVSTAEEPIKGWLDNFNGPVGLMMGAGKGIVRSICGDCDLLIDYIPVDIAIKAMLVTAWRRGITTITKDPSIPVYNASSCGVKGITNRDLMPLAFQTVEITPLDDTVWIPAMLVQKCPFVHYVNFLLFQLLPALAIDGLLKLSGAKPRLVKLQRKIFTANFALKYFLMEYWKFTHDKLWNLITTIPEIDKPDFNFDMGTLDIPTYFRDSVIGSKMYLLKEDMNRLPQARAHYNRLWWIDRTLKVWFFIFLIWAGLSSGLFAYVLNFITSMFNI